MLLVLEFGELSIPKPQATFEVQMQLYLFNFISLYEYTIRCLLLCDLLLQILCSVNHSKFMMVTLILTLNVLAMCFSAVSSEERDDGTIGSDHNSVVDSNEDLNEIISHVLKPSLLMCSPTSSDTKWSSDGLYENEIYCDICHIVNLDIAETCYTCHKYFS